jgi:flavin reductase (DIM6/NTAB) family NADH-FMN oxidoreductase RutF
MVCLSDKNRTFRIARYASVLGVHLVPQGAEALAELFGSTTGDDIDKFEHCSWKPGPGGAPILDDCDTWFAGRILDRLDVGDHSAFVLEPLQGDAQPGEEALSSQEAMAIPPGHEP